MILKCTKCGNKLVEAKSCVFCEGVKPYITVEEDGVGIRAADIGQQLLELLSLDTEYLKSERKASKKYDPTLSGALAQAARTATTLLAELRKYKEEDNGKAEHTVSEEKILFLEWLGVVPLMIRRDTIRAIKQKFDEDFKIASNM